MTCGIDHGGTHLIMLYLGRRAMSLVPTAMLACYYQVRCVTGTVWVGGKQPGVMAFRTVSPMPDR